MRFVMRGKGAFWGDGLGGWNTEGWWVDGCLGKSGFGYCEEWNFFEGVEEGNKGLFSYKQFMGNITLSITKH